MAELSTNTCSMLSMASRVCKETERVVALPQWSLSPAGEWTELLLPGQDTHHPAVPRQRPQGSRAALLCVDQPVGAAHGPEQGKGKKAGGWGSAAEILPCLGSRRHLSAQGSPAASPWGQRACRLRAPPALTFK